MTTSFEMRSRVASRGIERQTFRDPVTGREIWRLTQSELEDKHTYYDICPWSHDGRFILFSTARGSEVTKPFAHDTLFTDNGTVCVIETATWEIGEVAHGVLYQAHPGAFCMWHPRALRAIYRADLGSYEEVDLASGERRRHAGIIRQLSPDGKCFAVILGSPHHGEQGTAVATTDLATGETREIVNREQLYEVTPNRDRFRPDEMLLGNTKWSPDGETLLVAMWSNPHPALRRSLYLVDRDGGHPRWLAYFAHHHNWTPSGRAIIYNGQPGAVDDVQGRQPAQMCQVDAQGGEPRVIGPAGSHPAMRPDEESIADADRQGVYLYHLADGRKEYLAAFRHPFEMTHRGTHPHAVWNRDGTQVLYNSAETGTSQVYLIPSV